MKLILVCLVCGWSLLAALCSSSAEMPDFKVVVESHGYVFLADASGIKEISSGVYVLRVFVKQGNDEQYMSVFVRLEGASLETISKMNWSGGGVQIEVVDINSDGHSDLITSEFYEPELYIQVFLGLDSGKFTNVFSGESSSKPNLVELIDNKFVCKELILTSDPYGFSFDPLFVPKLYVYDGQRFVPFVESGDSLPN